MKLIQWCKCYEINLVCHVHCSLPNSQQSAQHRVVIVHYLFLNKPNMDLPRREKIVESAHCGGSLSVLSETWVWLWLCRFLSGRMSH